MELDVARLPSELVIHVATFLDPASLARLERVSKQWRALMLGADACWARHAGHGATYHTSLCHFLRRRRNTCIDSDVWRDGLTWKQTVCRIRALKRNWSCASPHVETSVVGYPPYNPAAATAMSLHTPAPVTRSRQTGQELDIAQSNAATSFVWRARLDTATDAQFIVTTWLSGGVRVIDARPDGHGKPLWELPRWSVRPYAHLEYRDGIACWDSDAGIEVWKRWKLVQHDVDARQEDEPSNKRGTFVHVGTIPDMPGMRGFMLNEALHLTIVSSTGRSWTYDVGREFTGRLPSEVYNFPVKPGGSWVYDFPIRRGATGHIEHDLDHAVYCLGVEGYAVYHKASAKHLGDVKFKSGPLLAALEQCATTNMMWIDTSEELPRLHQDAVFQPAKVRNRPKGNELAVLFGRDPLNPDAAPLLAEGLTPRRATRKPLLADDEWGATMLRQLDDGATLLVARSSGGRFMICSDLLGLLACMADEAQEQLEAKVRQCLAIVECGGIRCLNEFHAGGWLTVHQSKAAWEIEDKVYIFTLPSRKDTLPTVHTHVMTLNGRYCGEVPMPHIEVPVSIMSLHDDCLLTTYLHPAYIRAADRAGFVGWERSYVKSVRLVRFAPRAMEATAEDDSTRSLDESADATAADAPAPLTWLERRKRDWQAHRDWYISSRMLAGQPIGRAEMTELLMDERGMTIGDDEEGTVETREDDDDDRSEDQHEREELIDWHEFDEEAEGEATDGDGDHVR